MPIKKVEFKFDERNLASEEDMLCEGKHIEDMTREEVDQYLRGYEPRLVGKYFQLVAEDALLTQQAKAMRDALLKISGLVSATWGDADFDLPNGIQGIFDALDELDKKSPDWQCREF